ENQFPRLDVPPQVRVHVERPHHHERCSHEHRSKHGRKRHQPAPLESTHLRAPAHRQLRGRQLCAIVSGRVISSHRRVCSSRHRRVCSSGRRCALFPHTQRTPPLSH